jgi:hypothetical protein
MKSLALLAPVARRTRGKDAKDNKDDVSDVADRQRPGVRSLETLPVTFSAPQRE